MLDSIMYRIYEKSIFEKQCFHSNGCRIMYNDTYTKSNREEEDISLNIVTKWRRIYQESAKSAHVASCYESI